MSSSKFSARNILACLKSASYAASLPATAPVCELDALLPAVVVPDFRATIGLARFALTFSRPSATSRGASVRFSVYMPMVLVPSSLKRYSRSAFSSVTALLPIEAKSEKPSDPLVRSRNALVRAPLWEKKAMEPPMGIVEAKEALRKALGLMKPRQFGPRIEM